jgi:hypothetical protein
MSSDRRPTADPRTALAGWYLRGGLRGFWQLPLILGGLLLLALLLLRGLAEDPHENLRVSRARLKMLQPPDVPDEENAALVIESALAARVKYTGPNEFNPEMILGRGHKTFERPEVQLYFAANANVMRQLLVAAEMEKCSFQVDFTTANTFPIRHMSSCRFAARLLATYAQEQARRGNHVEAAHAVRGVFQIARKLEMDRLLICRLVTDAIRDLGYAAVEVICQVDPPAAISEVDAYQQALPTERDPYPSMNAVIDAESAWGLFAFDQLAVQRCGANTGGSDLSYLLRGSTVLWYGPERHAFLDVVNGFREFTASRQIPSRALSIDLLRKYQQGPVTVIDSLLPSFGRAWVSMLQCAERGRVVGVGLDCLRFRLKHGRDPGTLEDLCPEMRAAVPRDLFHGHAFRLLVDAPGEEERKSKMEPYRFDRLLRIYSFGPNGKDDGGKPTWVVWSSEDYPGDVTFAIPALGAKRIDEDPQP